MAEHNSREDTSSSIAVVLPVYNEEANLQDLHASVSEVMATLGRDFEIIYVDDGSTDGSFGILRDIASRDQHVKVCRFARNCGQTAAIAAGIDLARSGIVCFMDADLQNDPADIPAMLEKLEEGYDLVSGWRKDRKDTWLTRRLPSLLANALISAVTGVRLHDYGCTLKIYRRDVLKGFRLYGEMHRFIPAYASQMGARVVEMPVNHRARTRGTSKYGLERIVKVVLDLFVVKYLSNYSNRPIHFFGGVGVALTGAGVAVLAFLIWDKFVNAMSMIESPLLLLSVMFFMLGVHSVFIGLLAELLNRTYHESQDKPTYVVKEILSSGDEHTPQNETTG